MKKGKNVVETSKASNPTQKELVLLGLTNDQADQLLTASEKNPEILAEFMELMAMGTVSVNQVFNALYISDEERDILDAVCLDIVTSREMVLRNTTYLSPKSMDYCFGNSPKWQPL